MAIVDSYLWFLHLDRRMSLDVDLGPLHRDVHRADPDQGRRRALAAPVARSSRRCSSTICRMRALVARRSAVRNAPSSPRSSPRRIGCSSTPAVSRTTAASAWREWPPSLPAACPSRTSAGCAWTYGVELLAAMFDHPLLTPELQHIRAGAHRHQPGQRRRCASPRRPSTWARSPRASAGRSLVRSCTTATTVRARRVPAGPAQDAHQGAAGARHPGRRTARSRIARARRYQGHQGVARRSARGSRARPTACSPRPTRTAPVAAGRPARAVRRSPSSSPRRSTPPVWIASSSRR